MIEVAIDAERLARVMEAIRANANTARIATAEFLCWISGRVVQIRTGEFDSQAL